MNRRNAFTLKIHENEWDNSELLTLLYLITDNREIVLENQPQYGDGIFWISNPVKELFKYSDCFDWICGSAKLWTNGVPLTRYNYKTLIIEEDYRDVEDYKHTYSYVDYDTISDVAPITDNELI